MDNKDNNNQFPIHDPINWKSLGFFSSEEYLLYVFKKVEKITAALYLVSGLLKDEEPIKWELRDRGMDLLTSSFTASSALPGDKNIVIQALFTAALETISLLNVAKISNLVTDMNHRLLVREIDQILTMMRDKLAANAESAGYVLSESFFKTPNLFSGDFKNVSSTNADTKSDAKISQSGVVKKTLSGNVAQLSSTHKGHADVQEKKSERQEIIISALKGQSNLTIKDFARIIKGCSEKTIQRELIHLVDNGVIKKEGERRWSRYSLK
jgi:predicted transcriptional regulator